MLVASYEAACTLYMKSCFLTDPYACLWTSSSDDMECSEAASQMMHVQLTQTHMKILPDAPGSLFPRESHSRATHPVKTNRGRRIPFTSMYGSKTSAQQSQSRTVNASQAFCSFETKLRACKQQHRLHQLCGSCEGSGSAEGSGFRPVSNSDTICHRGPSPEHGLEIPSGQDLLLEFCLTIHSFAQLYYSPGNINKLHFSAAQSPPSLPHAGAKSLL